jgi:hypothetical protein
MSIDVKAKIAARAYEVPLPQETKNLSKDDRYKVMNDYHIACSKMWNEIFRGDLEQEFGVVGHPKSKRLFELAWEHGHSSGLNDVYYYYSDFVELITP